MDTLELPVADGRSPAGTPRPAYGDRGRGRTPRARPPLTLRLFVGVLAFGAMLTTVALLLSDRAPGALQMLFGDRAGRLWARIDASERVDLPPGSELPGTDAIVHLAIWAVVAVLVGLTVWGWRALAAAAIVLAGVSIALELGQGRYSDTRAVEASDAVANLVGIGAGVVAVSACYLLWSGVATAMGRIRPR